MATTAVAPPAPFVVGRPAPDTPLPSFGSGLRIPGLGQRAKTTLGVTTTTTTANSGVSSSSSAAAATLLRHRTTVTSQPRGWPRLVVRDVSGRTLDTFTTLQDAIYRASWTIKTMHEWPVTPLQWRLPKAPVPSRPDFSRAGTRALLSYSLDLTKSYSLDLTKSYRPEVQSAPLHRHPVLEIDVDDVSFVAESLKLLPHLPSFAFLRHSLLAGELTYLRVVGSLLLHQRHVTMADKRHADYTFPGFCSGCRRAGFCYGCAKNPRPHVHEDIPMRTGGGFVYYRRDRPIHQDPLRHPCNWPSTGDAEKDLRHIIERCGGLAAYERAVKAAHGVMESGQMTSQLPVLRTFSRVRLLTGPWPRQKNIFPALDSSDKDEEEKEEEGEEAEEDEAGEEEGDEEEDEGDDDRRPVTVSFDRPERKSALKKQSADTQFDERKFLRRSVTIDTSATGVESTEGEEQETEEEEAEAQRQKADDTEEDTEGGRETGYDSGIDGSDRYRPSRRKIGISHTPSSRPSTLSPPRSLTLNRSRSRSDSRSRSSATVAFGGSVRTSRGTSAVSEDTTESAESRKARLENIPFAKKRRDVQYKAPSFFKPTKRQRRITVARDPFSKERQYNIPKGGNFQLKKSERQATKFVEFRRGDSLWKAPKKFELKQQERQTTQFWSRGAKGKGKGRRGGSDDEDDEARRRRRKAGSEDSGLDTDLRSASTGDKDRNAGEDERDDDDNKGGENDVTGDGSGEVPETEKKPRTEIVKKVRRPISPPGVRRRQRSPSPPPPRQPTPVPSPPPTPPPPSPPPAKEIPLPDIPLPDIGLPDLPEWKEKEKAERQKKQKFLVAPPPALKEVPKKRRPPPKVRRPLKVPVQRLKTKPAEAPVNTEQVQDMQDPLDWLAKYCIINPDRLPLYEMIFESVIADQVPRYSKPLSHPSVNEVLKEAKDAAGEDDGDDEEGAEKEGLGGKETTKKKKKEKKGKKKKKRDSSKDREEKELSQLVFMEKSLNQPKVGLSLPEQQLEKLVFTLDTLHHRLEGLGSELSALEDKRTKQVAGKARELFPEVASPDYAPKTKKKGKKSKSKPTTPAVKLKPEDITDDVILTRLDDKMLAAVRHEPEIRQTELEIGRAREKMSDVTERLEELASEKLMTDVFCMNHYFARQGLNDRPPDFRRQQSELFNRLNPHPDYEMNLEEVEDALQHINGHLLTQKEFFFLYNVLNLPARSSINFRLFSVIAALSEKVTQLDPVIRQLINNTDYNALDIKMEKCRELFRFVEEDEGAPKGRATADRLAVELTAGGLTPEHTRFVLSKFNRERKGLVDFLDFVTYIPLFILIHRRIISHPLREELDL